MLVLDLLLVVLNLPGSKVVLLDHLLVRQASIAALVAPISVLLVDQLLGSFTKHALLLPVIVKRILVVSTLLCSCSEHVVTVAHSVTLFHVFLLLFEPHGGI